MTHREMAAVLKAVDLLACAACLFVLLAVIPDVEARGVGRFVLAATGSGDIDVEGVGGDVEVGSGGSGDLTFRRVDGSVRAVYGLSGFDGANIGNPANVAVLVYMIYKVAKTKRNPYKAELYTDLKEYQAIKALAE